MKKRDKLFGSIAELTTSNFDADQIFQFWLLKKNNGSSYTEDKMGRNVKRAFPISYMMKLEEQITLPNKTTGRPESVIIRHCIGESEIFKHLQSPDDKIPKIVTKLNFIEGHKNIEGTDPSILQFLALSNRNASKPNRDTKVNPVFFLHDGNAVVEKLMEAENDLFEIQQLIRDPKNLDMLVAYARVILSKNDFDKIYGKADHIVFRMLGLAKQNPTLFKEGLRNAATLKKHYILEAIEEGQLTFSEANNAIYFKNGELLQQAPIGLSPINVFVDKITEDRTGNTEVLYKMVLKSIQKDEKISKKAESTTDAIDDTTKDNNEDVAKNTIAIGLEAEMLDLAKRAMSKGVLILKKPSAIIWNQGTAKEKAFLGYNGKRGIVAALMNEPEFAQAIKTQTGQ